MDKDYSLNYHGSHYMAMSLLLLMSLIPPIIIFVLSGFEINRYAKIFFIGFWGGVILERLFVFDVTRWLE